MLKDEETGRAGSQECHQAGTSEHQFKGMRVHHTGIWRKSPPGRGNSKFKSLRWEPASRFPGGGRAGAWQAKKVCSPREAGTRSEGAL